MTPAPLGKVRTWKAERFASDTALLLYCLTHGLARWCPFPGPADGRGEVAVNGIRHGVTINDDGSPDLSLHLRQSLLLILTGGRQ